MLIGKPPFETSDVKTTYRRIRMNAYTFPDHIPISEAAKDTISRILTNDPAKRPSLDELLMHEFINTDGSIPRLLPASTLACPPSATYIRQFLGDEPQQKVKIRVINEPKPVEDVKETDSPAVARPESGRFKGPKVWVKKWVDYSSKYGLGYLLSNASTGVFFNDSTKIVLDIDAHNFIYYERRASDKKDIGQNHTLTDYPKELQKKVTLLQHFRSYLEGGKKDGEADSKNIGTERMKEEEEKVVEEEKKVETAALEKKPMSEDTVYVKKWMRTRHAIMFRLSNKVVQVNFQDHTEIILSSESKVVTYVNKKGERLTYPLSTAMESSNMEMAKRLKYTKDILTHMLQSNQTNRVGNNRDLEPPK